MRNSNEIIDKSNDKYNADLSENRVSDEKEKIPGDNQNPRPNKGNEEGDTEPDNSDRGIKD